MITQLEAKGPILSNNEEHLVTFYCGNMLFGLDIDSVQEINRQVDITPVPETSLHVRGAINLRGAVVTVVDLRTALALPSVECTKQSRNVIVNHQGELIGLLVDKVSNIISVSPNDMEPPPSNIQGIDSRFFRGVCTINSEIIAILDFNEIF